MVSASQQHKKQMEKANFSFYKYNRRKLKIALEQNCISKEHYNQIKIALDDNLSNGIQSSFEELFISLTSLPFHEILPIINKELFKYNQIIIKLAQQFAKNTTTQQLKFQKQDSVFIQQANDRLHDVFSKILKDITNDYLASKQNNIDEILLESGFIKESQLEFLHGSAEHLEIKAQDRKFGELAVKNEFTTQEIVNGALDEQTERYKKTNKNHIIGDILVEQNHISPEIRNEILIIQNRVLEEDWEETLKEVGQSSIEEKEKNALFGALVIKDNLLDEKQVIEALKIQAKELEAYHKRKELEKNNIDGVDGKTVGSKKIEKKFTPRWIGDILVQDFGLSERDRKRIVKKQMDFKIERINLKLGLNISSAHIELFNEMEKYFELSYSKDNIEAYVKAIKPVPKNMTKDNINIWLYHKKISYGRINAAIESLSGNKIKLGKAILIAKGDDPVPAEMTYKFHFDTKKKIQSSQTSAENTKTPVTAGQTSAVTAGQISAVTAGQTSAVTAGQTSAENTKTTVGGIFPFVVFKGTKLVTLQKVKGKSGLNVNRCFVVSPMVTPITIIKGENVIRNENEFVAACDGVPNFSDNRVLSVSSVIYIDGDMTVENLPTKSSIEFECDFDVRGTIESGVVLECRKLRVNNFKGQVTATDDVTVLLNTINGEIISKGNIHLASVENSTITSEKNIAIQLNSDESNITLNKISNSVIISDDIFRISDAEIVSSVIRAKNKVILKKVIVGEKCKFIVGDSIEAVGLKKKIELLNTNNEQIDIKIKEIQTKSRELFEKIEKKDIAAIDDEIKMLSKNQRTKDDIDRIAELRVIKRQKEKEYETSIDKYGSIFMQHSEQIKQYQEQKKIFEKESKELTNRIMAIYKKEPEIPELDIRRSVLPAGTLIQFRYHQQELTAACEGFIFREEFNPETHQYEVKQHRW